MGKQRWWKRPRRRTSRHNSHYNQSFLTKKSRPRGGHHGTIPTTTNASSRQNPMSILPLSTRFKNRYREFAGRLSYRVVHDLWKPSDYLCVFGKAFQDLAVTLFACQQCWESPFRILPYDSLGLGRGITFWTWVSRWDWAEDTFDQVLHRQQQEQLQAECKWRQGMMQQNEWRKRYRPTW